jgi:PKD repeat protein
MQSGAKGVYSRGIRFTPSVDMEITKLSRNAGSIVSIYTDSGTLLFQRTFSTPTPGVWVEENLSTPLALTANQTYRISTWDNNEQFYYYYDLLENVSSDPNITVNGGCYGWWGYGAWPNNLSDKVYGLVNFKFVAGARDYSGASNNDAKCTLIHDPTDSDWTCTLSGTDVDVNVTPPPNPTAGQTGVKVERAADLAFTENVTVVQGFTSNYSLSDNPGPGMFYYRITFRNQEGVETAESAPKAAEVPGELVSPTNFSGVGVATNQIEWTWNDDVTDADGYVLEDDSNTVIAIIPRPASSYQETVGGENTAVTRQLRSAMFSNTTVSVEPAVTGSFPWPWQEAGRHMQFLYAAGELSDQPGFITKIYWQRMSSGGAETYSNVTVTLGHTTLNSLGADFADNFTEGDATEVWNAASYAVPAASSSYEWVEIPVTGSFYYDGVNNLVVDINVESGTGDLYWCDNSSVTDNTALYAAPGAASGTSWDVKFLVRFDVQVIGGTSEPTASPVTVYSLVHDASPDDFALSNPSERTVVVNIVEPSNSHSGYTGVKIERASDIGFSDATTVQDFTDNYLFTDDSIATDGTYWYRITCCNGDGVPSVTSEGQSITVPGGGGPPIANFSANPTTGNVPLTVQFSDESIGEIDTWSWDFGDGATSTDQSPVHEYTSAGTYTVTLTVSGTGGSDSESKTDYITVSEPGTIDAGFSGNPISGDSPLTVSFTDESSGTYDSWYWDFGDGSISTGQNPAHTYNLVGTYTVTLTIDGPEGSDSESKTNYITVTDPGTISAGFNATPTSGEAPLVVQFIDQSIGNVTSWSWNFGDGGTSAEQHPSHQYTNPGIYTVSLTVTGPAGDATETKVGYINVSGAPPGDGSGSSGGGGCSCTVDSSPRPLNHLLGYFMPILLLACAYFVLRRGSSAG